MLGAVDVLALGAAWPALENHAGDIRALYDFCHDGADAELVFSGSCAPLRLSEDCRLYTSPSPRDMLKSPLPSSS